MTDEIVVAGGWANNARMIADAVVPLGHLRADKLTLDLTHGLGAFWTYWQPDRLVALDVDWAKHLDRRWRTPTGPYLVADSLRLPFRPRTFWAVVVDGPYKLNGTATGAVDSPYGVDSWKSAPERHQLMAGMLRSAAEVVEFGGRVLFKCQNQVNSGTRWWQDQMFTRYAETLGLDLVERFELPSGRPQPKRSTCLRCRRALMRREDGRWGTVSRARATDPFTCPVLAGTLDFDAGPDVAVEVKSVGHDPDPDDVGQEHARNNQSTLLVFVRRYRPRYPTGEIRGLEDVVDVPSAAPYDR